jgi:hypothetical protein
MNGKRSLSALVLTALLVTQALPAHAGAMLCPMKAESRTQVACTGCDSPRSASTGLLRSRGCCHMTPGEASDATPVVLSMSRRAPSAPYQSMFDEAVPLLASSVPDGFTRAIAWSEPPDNLLASSFRSPVLRN